MCSSIRWAFRFGCWQPTQEEWTHSMACVQPEERERINRFVFRRDSKAALAGRLLLRKVISEVVGIPYDRISLARSDKGKPFLVCDDYAQGKHFHFNVSHHGQFAVLAAEQFHDVGVDVMSLDRPRGTQNIEQFFSTMDRQFTGQEWTAIRSGCDDQQQLANFYRFWCLKESYVKALGTGIGFSLQRLDFRVHSPLSRHGVVTDTALHLDGTVLSQCHLQESMLDDRHIACVAVNQAANALVASETQPFQLLTIEDLLRPTKTLATPSSEDWENFVNKTESPV